MYHHFYLGRFIKIQNNLFHCHEYNHSAYELKQHGIYRVLSEQHVVDVANGKWCNRLR